MSSWILKAITLGTTPTEWKSDGRFLAEEDGNIGTQVKRQFLHTHRSFKAHILDKQGKEILFVVPISNPLTID
jgi:hypothetical protein